MNKQDFLAALRGLLNDLPAEDIRRSLDFYAEMIDDHMEDGMTEEDTVDLKATSGSIIVPPDPSPDTCTANTVSGDIYISV